MNREVKWTPAEIEIIRAALPVIKAVPRNQDECWPGDYIHDEECTLEDHEAAQAAVDATEGISWDFYGWDDARKWMERASRNATFVLSDPHHPGKDAQYNTEAQVRQAAAWALDIAPSDLVTVKCDEATYCYRSQEESDADPDGAYAVSYTTLGATR